MPEEKNVPDGLTRRGVTVVRVAECGSTNLLAREYARGGGSAPALFLSDRQTAGRGRLGRSFFSPEGGLYLSLLLPAEKDAHAVPLTVRVAAIAARVLEDLSGGRVLVKWVNDLYMGGRKVAGILAEGIGEEGARHTVVGIGVNLCETDFPADLPLAGSVAAFAPRAPERDVLAAALTEGILSGIGDEEALAEYRARSFLDGKRIEVLRGDTATPATAVGVTDTCALRVRYGDGTEEDLSSGDVRILPELP